MQQKEEVGAWVTTLTAARAISSPPARASRYPFCSDQNLDTPCLVTPTHRLQDKPLLVFASARACSSRALRAEATQSRRRTGRTNLGPIQHALALSVAKSGLSWSRDGPTKSEERPRRMRSAQDACREAKSAALQTLHRTELASAGRTTCSRTKSSLYYLATMMRVATLAFVLASSVKCTVTRASFIVARPAASFCAPEISVVSV